MNIGGASKKTGLRAKTIRYYEDIGLLKPTRSENGYRAYAANDIHDLRFLQRARSLGFTVEECRQLLSLYHDRTRASSDVKAIATTKMTEIDLKIRTLEEMRDVLLHLIDSCHGDHRPDCPIIGDLSANGGGSDIRDKASI